MTSSQWRVTSGKSICPYASRLRGLTLVELLITLGILMVLMTTVSRAYVVGIDYDTRMRDARAEVAHSVAFEERLRDLIQHAHLSDDANQAASYFIGSVGNGQDAQGTVSSGDADTLILTVSGLRLRGDLMVSADDFETLNQKYGPQGGVEEVAISTTPVGTPSNNQSGMFLREQRPADGDPTQGGYESLLQQDVDYLRFEFWDGQEWLTSWDTRSMTTKRLPAQVRVTYRMNGSDQDHTLQVLIPASDVTAQNPVEQEAPTTP